jgi:uncharacterized DUF497 family protein
MLEIEFDLAKDAINRQKHGIGLAAAALLFDGPILRQADTRFDYGEDRWAAIGRIEDQFFCVCYTMRGRVYRIVNMRRASRKERQAYAKAYP